MLSPDLYIIFVCAYNLSTPIFCRCQYFFDTLSTTIFCLRLNFVYTNILSTPIFCWRQYFVDTNILSRPIFCWRLYFVDTYILSTPIFCPHQYFVDAMTPIFCQRLYFTDANILSMPRYLLAPIFIEFIANYCVVNYQIIMIINLFKTSQVLIAIYLSITVLITIKVSYNHTRMV